MKKRIIIISAALLGLGLVSAWVYYSGAGAALCEHPFGSAQPPSAQTENPEPATNAVCEHPTNTSQPAGQQP